MAANNANIILQGNQSERTKGTKVVYAYARASRLKKIPLV